MRVGRSSPVAVVVVFAACVVAWGRSAESVVPGQKLFGELGPNERVTVLVDVPAGMTLAARCSAYRGTSPRLDVSLADPDGVSIDLGALKKTNAKGTLVTFKGVSATRTGAYRVAVSTSAGTAGGFDLTVTGTSPLAPKGAGTIDTPGAIAVVPFVSMPGDKVTCAVRPARRSKLKPFIRRFVDAGGAETLIDAARQKAPVLAATVGTSSFEITGAPSSVGGVGTTGAFTWKVKIVRARPPKTGRDAADLNVAGTISGAIVVDGEATHAESVRVAKSMRRPGAPDVRSGELVVAALDARSFAEIEAAACAAMPGAACSVAAALSDHGPYLVRVEHLVGRRDARAKSATRALAKSATTVGSFEWIEPNGVVAAFDEPNDPLYAEQFALREMRVPYVWSMTQGDPSIVVAVLDSGTMPHPDLDGQYVAGYDFVSDPASSMDGDGWDADPSDAAYVLHGTHVAGIIGAKANNQIGVAGVAWNTRILPVRVLGGQGGTWFDVAAGLRWAVGLPVSGAPANPTPARVVNMSIGTYYDSEVQRGTVAEIVSTRPEVVLVAAAGNESTNYPLYPAAYPGVIAVYALDRNFHWTTYSNYGTWISVGAFGGDWWRGEPGILSTFWDMATNQPDYEELCGTSMASPQVAGVAALLLALKPTMTGAEVKDALQRTAWDLGAPGFDTDYGWGAVNALAAATFVTSPFALPEAIDVAPAALAFEGAALAADVFVRTKSATPVTISQVDATMDEVGAAGRLTASLDQSVTPATATVRIDPSLADGVYSGKIRLTTSVGIVDVPVRVVRSPRSNLNNVLVSAVDPVGRVVATTTTSAAKNWAWSLSEVPLGQYRIVALGDQNGSLKFDRVDEWEGAWPLVTQPQNVDVTTDSLDSAGIDIPISRYDARVSYAGVGQGGIAGAVAVRVTDAADRAIAAAAVHVGGGAPLTTTDARGRGVVVGSMMGGQVVTAVADGFLPITRIGEDAQYQSFTLPSSDAPATTVVVATVRGLAASDRDVYVQVGDARGHVVYAGGADPAFTLTVTNSAGTVPVSAVAFDSTGVPTRHALYEMAAPVPAFDVQLTALASGGAQSRTVQPSAPTSNFTTAGATASSAAYVRWSGTSWVDVGESPLTFGQNKTGWWAAPDAPATPLAMKFEVVATDAAGRWSRRIVYGDTSGPPAAAGAFALDTPTRPIVPADGATGVSTAPILAWDDVPGAQLERLVVEQPGTPWRWTFWIAGSLYHVDLPSLLKGGLAPATNYRWSVETFRFASGFDASNYRDDRVETTSTSRTFSGWSMFRTQ